MKPVATRAVSVGALSLALAACVTAPVTRLPDLHEQARTLASRQLDDTGLRAAEARLALPSAANEPWTPDRIIVAAWYFDPQLAQARAGATRAAADAVLAAQRANPTLELSPEKVFSGATASSPWTIGIALLLPLLHPGEAAARRDVATASTEMAKDQLALAVWQSRSRSLGALREVLLTRRAETLAARVTTVEAAYRDSVRQRVAVGASDRAAQLTAELEAQRSAADLASRHAQRMAAEQALAGAIGVPWSALRDVILTWPQLDAPPAPSALPAVALAQEAAWNRLDLAALLAQYRVADAQLRAAAGTRYPTTSIAPGYIYDQGQRKFSFGVDVELPLFHGARARIRASAAARDEAAAAVRARQADILHALDAARADYTARYDAWTRMRRAAEAARQVADRAQRRRIAGEADRGSERVAQVTAAQAELAALDALTTTLNSLGTLEDTVQRPVWPPSRLPQASATDDSISSPGETDHAHSL
ncbi:MAG: TolC family protein [Rhodanobacteraceae bacterium]|nr:MAG: TolC family protein [Rhodanobacteraceae bacterium]